MNKRRRNKLRKTIEKRRKAIERFNQAISEQMSRLIPEMVDVIFRERPLMRYLREKARK